MMRYLVAASLMTLAGSLPAIGAEATCPGEGQIKSASTEINSEITFENNSGADRKIFWIDFEGARVHYGDIAAQASHSQPAFLGQAWMITDADENCLEFYFAETSQRRIALGGASAAAAPSGAEPPRQAPPITNKQNVDDNSGAYAGASQPAAADGNPCEAGEYWNRSRNICINTTTKARRTPSAAAPAGNQPNGPTGRVMRCRPGYVQSGTKCVRQSSSIASERPRTASLGNGGPARVLRCRPGFVQSGTKCIRQSASITQDPQPVGGAIADADNEENRPDDLCGPGFTDIGGGCISNSLLKQN